jgi:tRNA(fMet)-specific endonuclease VapC
LILLDTNTIIYYLKGVEAVVARSNAASRHEVAIPSLTVYEIEYGNRKTGSRRRAIVSALLAALTQVPFDGAAAQEAARIRIDLEAPRSGTWADGSTDRGHCGKPRGCVGRK